jgi:hypothetical protein
VDLAGRILDANDQHVFGKPAFRSSLPACDPERMAFLAEQGIAAITRANALDRELLGKMHDEPPLGIEVADRVQALYERALTLDALERASAHACHDAHVQHDIRAVRDLDAATRERRADGPHAVGTT